MVKFTIVCSNEDCKMFGNQINEITGIYDWDTEDFAESWRPSQNLGDFCPACGKPGCLQDEENQPTDENLMIALDYYIDNNDPAREMTQLARKLLRELRTDWDEDGPLYNVTMKSAIGYFEKNEVVDGPFYSLLEAKTIVENLANWRLFHEKSVYISMVDNENVPEISPGAVPALIETLQSGPFGTEGYMVTSFENTWVFWVEHL